jgi:hypothetical protein
MGPSRGDTICGNVAIEALGPMYFGALALGPIHFARNPTEPRMWLATVERTLLPRSVDVSRFMAGIGELASREIVGTIPLVLVDREADFCVVGYRAVEGARTLAAIAEQGADDAAAAVLGTALAQTLAELHGSGVVHGLITPTTIVHDGRRWLTWEYGIAGLCAADRLAPRLRPLGGDVVAPELRAGGEVSPASDVFGWGAAVACLLTGSIGSDAVATMQDGDETDPLRELVRACLDPIPEMRPRDAAMLLARLAKVPTPPPRPIAAAAAESAEFSFAELNEPTAPAASPSAERSGDTHEIVELLSLGDDDDDDDDADDAVGAPGPADSAESWRGLAEEYLSPEPALPVDRTPLPVELEEVGPTERRSVEALGRVALVKTRVRTGPQKPTAPMDHVFTSGEFEMSQEEPPEPPPPRVLEGAPELPLGSPDEDDWEDPEAAVFDLDAAGSPRVEVEHEDIDPDPGPSPWPTPPDGEGRERPVSWSEPTPVDGLRSRQLERAPEPPPPPPVVQVEPPKPPPVREPTPEPVAVADILPPLRLAKPVVEPAPPRRETPPPRRETPPPRDEPVVRAEPPVMRVPLGETPAVSALRARTQSDDTIPALELDRSPSRPHAVVPSRPIALDRTPSRPQPIPAELSMSRGRVRSGAWFAWTIALVTTAVAVGATLAAARDAGGLSRLIAGGGAAPPSEAAPPTADGPAPEPAPGVVTTYDTCPSAMRPIEGTRVCIDEAEAPGLGEIPKTRITFADASAACAERGAKLCTTQQWRSACRGTRNWRHPYGSRGEADRCNGAAPSGAVQDLSRAGARDGCVTPSGVYDLEGNVGEWVAEGAVLGGDSSTRSPSCDSRTQPSAGTVSPSTGYRCCVQLTEPG